MLITPNWQAPSNVRAILTTRHHPDIQTNIKNIQKNPNFGGFNLATHVGDDPETVRQNRQDLRKIAKLAQEPAWLNQTHGVNVVLAEHIDPNAPPPDADAVVSFQVGKPCVVMTADCLPILLCDRAGSVVAAVHAGWRSLCGGIIERTVYAMNTPPDQLMAWLGPCIGARGFEVGAEVRAAFMDADSDAQAAFTASVRTGHFLADLVQLATQRLAKLCVRDVSMINRCTWSETQDFYSFRRSAKTGRFATLVCLT